MLTMRRYKYSQMAYYYTHLVRNSQLVPIFSRLLPEMVPTIMEAVISVKMGDKFHNRGGEAIDIG